jgi:hypothetical protein
MATRRALSGFGLIGVSYLAPSGGVAHLVLAAGAQGRAASGAVPLRREPGAAEREGAEGAATRGLARLARSNFRSRTVGRSPSPCVM